MFKFKNGDAIKCNRYLLASKHLTFYKLLFDGELQPEKIKIKDFDSQSFKLFLDCLIGIKKCSQTDLAVILPIAFKYQIDEFIQKWLKLFKPSKLELNAYLCDLLNSAFQFKCDSLVDSILEFLRKDCRIYKLLETQNLCLLLEPDSMRILLNFVQMDSYMYKILFSWAKHYLKINNIKDMWFKGFFAKHKMFHFISLENFETPQSIFAFNEDPLTKKFFTNKEILDYLSKTVYSKKKSQWVKMGKGESFEEVLTTGTLYLAKNCSLQFDIHRNNVVFYEWPVDDITSPIDYVVSWRLLDVKNNNSAILRFKIFHENDLIKSLKMAYLALCVQESGEEFILNEIKINYTFNVDCRILKTSADFQMLFSVPEKNDDVLFFTNSISTCLASTDDNK